MAARHAVVYLPSCYSLLGDGTRYSESDEHFFFIVRELITHISGQLLFGLQLIRPTQSPSLDFRRLLPERALGRATSSDHLFVLLITQARCPKPERIPAVLSWALAA
jgi:hypothetical protein